ncbi:MAG: folylpolyglutamate synthase/dihydrofolate synthase family protein [Thermodesulfovibrionales bacterium]|nr:folylpolyglutamate synthase/dihydrofolate synthase family protein [Thermodesulfovibrionales bacterium]
MSYCETINYLYSLQKHGIKFGLDNIIRLMAVLDNPHKSFLSVHVTGTNGKGSTSAITASVLKAAGLKVGLFTSPHLVSFTERIRVNDEEITEHEVVNLAEEIRGKIINLQSSIPDFSPTFFEVVTAMALFYFERKKIDVAVIEVGMGGRLDATNIIMPEVSIITNINYDHREFLGNTLKEIANEKAGIIKDGIPVVASYQESEAIEVIEKKVIEKDTVLYVYGRDFSSVLKKEDISGICFDYRDSDLFTIHDLVLPLAGEHQVQNASVAIKAATIVLNKNMVKHITKFIRDGLAATRCPGRLEFIKETPPILIDGAHNPAAAVALSNALVKNFLGRYKRIILVLGIMGDKDMEGIMKPLLPIASEIILTSPDYERAAPPAKLAGIAASLGFPDVHIAPTVRDAIEMAENIYQQSDPSSPLHPPLGKGGQRGGEGITHSLLIVVTGSFYTIGEAKEIMGHKGVLTRLRE